MKIKCKKLRENAVLPTRGTALAAGADLYALLPDGAERVTIPPQGKHAFPTGIAVEIPEGYVGELTVFLQNNGAEPQTVEIGERIAQLVITPCLAIEIEETGTLTDTARGAAGFGSTGTR